MTHTLALCLDAPMQSWGLRSRFSSRDTAQEPTKSGVVGLLAAALGIQRDQDDEIRHLAAARMGIRVDREGFVERDFHTVGDVPNTEGRAHRTVVSHRYYLADAVFLVALEHPDREQLLRWHAALLRPHWPIYLGRKAFVPARPLVSQEPEDDWLGVTASSVADTLERHGWLENRPSYRERVLRAVREGRAHPLRTLVDTEPTDPLAEPRRDVPVSFRPRNRLFGTRSVRTGHVQLTEPMIHAGAQPCT
ncbi:CRISPR-associated Cas5e family protein [Prauserella shujinwangii]|uniref:CRISPR-associated Cas5e family protein n=1 Tax=Prauserella shujinwangii TaxID=1453103 RepID=A0A2T0LKU2_9PSEU|nr:type I-E CRISPR-associated protein Cas5/CasD [Prauserella shujinwangii]PRX43581.1 CRISPR-associated Cas5e family protein [Prauserella shujinwangii]